MAKRKRLTPARPENLGTPAEGSGPVEASPETKSVFPSYPLGVAPKPQPAAPPIAHVAGDAATVAALAEVSEELHAARREGRMVQSLALEEVDATYLVRDRLVSQDADMEALCASLSARGQQTPIEVVQTATGFGLISGWRRLTALRNLYQQTGEARFASVLALVRQPRDAADAYVAMVEENEIRVGLSYFERASIVMRAVEEGVYPDAKKALAGLFSAGSRAKRSKIKSFLPVVEALGGVLHHPAAIGERLGLTLSQQLQSDPELKARLGKALEAQSKPDAEGEIALLTDVLAQAERPEKAEKPAAPAPLREDIAPGIWLQRGPKGLLIGGAGLTPQIEARVRRALGESS